jgi:membrane-bound inhibitor of C-type lysozyme
MFSNNLVSLLGNTIIYLSTMLTVGDNSMQTIVSDGKLLFDVTMIGLSGAVG